MPRGVTWWTVEAARDAVALARAGMPYPGIAIAIEHFHGLPVPAETVRTFCRKAGVPARRHGRRGENFRKVAA